MTTERVRESVIAGTWYSSNPEVLRAEIKRYLKDAKAPALEGDLIGLVAPHAGYMYSGGVAAHAYKMLERESFDRVLIVAPSHRAVFKGSSIYKLGGYRTPLGVVPLDRELVDEMFRQPARIDFVPHADSQEHSLEIQLPFLQVVLGNFKLIPIIMGDQSFDNCRELAEAIAAACRGKRVLLVASSDLSHYHPYKQAKLLDQKVMDEVQSFDASRLSECLKKGDGEACGGGPVITVMLAAEKLRANKAKVLHYANSGDVTGDTQGVVGYMAAAFYCTPGTTHHRSGPQGNMVGVDLGLTPDEKSTLREIAYQAIRSRCLGEPMPEIPASSPKLQESRGAFVCLHKGGDLRGCIGLIEGRGPLHETVRTMAEQAAFSDPRFCALVPEELQQIDLEISVLTPLEKMDDASQIEIGKHGIFIRKGYHSGLLLPQVATEHKWNPLQFLEWTCRKAGLPPNAWKDPETEIYVFSADIF